MTGRSTTFEAGQAYYARSLCDYDCFYYVLITARTESTVVTSEGKRFRIKLINGIETIAPQGRYSMSPTIYADARPLLGSEKDQMDEWVQRERKRIEQVPPKEPSPEKVWFDTAPWERTKRLSDDELQELEKKAEGWYEHVPNKDLVLFLIAQLKIERFMKGGPREQEKSAGGA